MHRANKHLFTLILAVQVGVSACTSQFAKDSSLKLAPADEETTSLKHAIQLIDQGKAVEAATAFRSLLRADGPSLPVFNGLAIAHAELGRPDLAADFFAQALALSPDDPVTLNNIGFAALRRQDTNLARRYLQMAKKVGEGTPEINANLNALERFENQRASLLVDGISGLSSAPTNSFAMQRKNASTIRLTKLQPSSDDQKLQIEILSESTEALIDFSELFDPWPANDSPTKPSL